MQKKFYAFALGALCVLASWAIPAKRIPRVVTQPDGTQLTVILMGDENMHYYQTVDGVPLCRRADGAFCYAVLGEEKLQAGTMLAHELVVRSEAEMSYVKAEVAPAEQLQQIAAQRLSHRNALRAARLARRMAPSAASVGQMSGVTGAHKGLVILVNFADVKMREEHTQQAFDDLMNKEGYAENGNAGSVHDYFYAQSYGQFDLTFDVVGPVTVSEKMEYYGGNDVYGNDKNVPEMVVEACKLASESVDFSQYDWDEDGEVDQVYLIYAGYGEAQGGADETIWPHEWDLSETNTRLTINGVKINTYGCSSELTGATGNELDGIGTPCHEFSHCLGLPDLYDTGGMYNFGMDQWSILDYGCYAGDGKCPSGYTSYERMASGWLTPQVLTETTQISGMKALTDSAEAYIIYNDAEPNEYYLLENRQLHGADASLPGHGLLILHVDYNQQAWENNTVNNVYKHERCTIFAADNKYNGKYAVKDDLAGDPYPGTSGNTSLTDTSKPSAQLYNANANNTKKMGKPITKIAETSDGLISFSFMEDENAEPPSGITPIETTASDALVTIYTIDGRKLRTATYGTWSVALPTGVYLLRFVDGTVSKRVK